MGRCTLLVPQVTVNGTTVMFNRSTYRGCHRTVSDEWSDLHCQCGGKEQHWRQRDIHWHGVCTLLVGLDNEVWCVHMCCRLFVSIFLVSHLALHPSLRLPLGPIHASGVSGGVLSLHPVEYQVPRNKCKGTVQVQSHLQCSQHCQAPVPPAHRGPGGSNWSGLQCGHHTHLD